MSIDPTTLKVGDLIRLNCEVVVTRVDVDDAKYPIQVEIAKDSGSRDWLHFSALEGATLVEAPLAVGDKIVHKESYANDRDSREIEAIIDFKGEPHLICLGWGRVGENDTRIAVPVADYRRATA